MWNSTVIDAIRISANTSAPPLNATSLKTQLKNATAIAKPPALSVSMPARRALKGILSLTISIRQISAVRYTAIVCISILSSPTAPLSKTVRIMPATTHSAAGSARVMILNVKLPRTIFLLGCKARTKDGKATVSALISVNCIGSKM